MATLSDVNNAIHATAEPIVAARDFTVLLSSTRRGARLARLLAERQLVERGAESEPALHIVAELAANAVLHGCVPGRDFRLTLVLGHGRPDTLRVEVTDAGGDRHPHIGEPVGDRAESGRGLLLVTAFADRWGVVDGPGPGCKTVWAEVDPERGST
ncbi:ATP-binding protein [Streptomyces sporangiiformans]|uniref:ATP-binding protein n=1 Tax=Streptomyces sporangiiformans TaxID=2315329 RepID=A0A505DMA3_9ACTN|nr:ATP-binding protein [Streptomyces sporangiiformans]TPQ20351.1 ATP-binding protein [Streptomyces sporangiiformans]